MENSFFHRLSSILWVGIVALMVLLAVYVSVGRMLASNLSFYKDTILHELNARAPFSIEAQNVRGEWHSFTPVIVLTGLRLSIPGSSDAPLNLAEGRLGVDVLNSLRTRSLQMTRVSLTDLSLAGELTPEGQFRLTGFGSGRAEIGQWLQELLLNVELIALRNNLLKLTMPTGEVRDLDLQLLLSRDGSQRRMEANLTSTRGTDITVLADGVGNPFQPMEFSGDLFLDISTVDLGAIGDLIRESSIAAWAEGEADIKVWMAWDKGLPNVEARLEARDLLVQGKDESWQVPLDRLALEAQWVERKNHWTVHAADIEIVQGGVELFVPRMQVDAWGSSLRIRATDVSLESVSSLATNFELMPQRLRDVLSSLRPRGHAPLLQLSLDNVAQPVDHWELEANFSDVAVDSYKGAPGVASADGYVRLAPAGGLVILDSQSLSMDFPKLFHNPLDFDDFHGSLYLDWDAQAFSISSGLVVAQGEEGVASVLFALDIPLVESDMGIDMDLLVGLKNSTPAYRDKYLPYVMDPALLKWLSESIGSGSIGQGAFLWSGSLRRENAHRRTIQLAFNVADMHLNYHPQWPPVIVDEGIILIDDNAVSVWAETGSILGSTVEQLSVETWLNDEAQIVLGLQGSIEGPAADGLDVLNDSPLTSIVGKAFADWQMTGELRSDLMLELNLSDKTVAPQVEVATSWRGVDLLVIPGNLPVQSLNGNFNYSTELGFSSTSLEAELWGEVVSAQLAQQHPGDQGIYDTGASVVDVVLASQVDMGDVRRWLGVAPLGFVKGVTTADVAIRVTPGKSPVLTVTSDLNGVELDLPEPWKKPADSDQDFRLEMPLAPGTSRAMLTLGEELQLELSLDSGSFKGGALGVNAPPAMATAGVFHVSGHASLVEAEQWIRFVTDYFSADTFELQAVPAPGGSLDGLGVGSLGSLLDSALESELESAAVGKGSPVPVPESTSPDSPGDIKVVVEALKADTLIIRGQALQDAVLGLSTEDEAWRFNLSTDWLRGEFFLSRNVDPSRADIEHLDLDRLAAFSLPGVLGDTDSTDSSKVSVLELPAIDMNFRNLYQSDRRLGELAFELRSEGAAVILENISGELAEASFDSAKPGTLIWQQGEAGYTEFKAVIKLQDLGQTLQYLGYERILETEQGRIDVDLRWPGSPQGFSLVGADGSLYLDLGSGSFLEASSGAAGALRVVSILNLADIVRRLSLTHMFESGIPFDSVKGEVYLHEGTIEVPVINIKGGSSFEFSGVSEVATQSLNGELVATLPVARNLPWIAALAASLPVAAGVYIASKVFDKQMSRLSSLVYSIEGSWNDPQVNFDRIFDNASRQKNTGPVDGPTQPQSKSP